MAARGDGLVGNVTDQNTNIVNLVDPVVALFGAILGGLVVWLITMTVDKKQKRKKAMLIIKSELLLNRDILKSYLNYYIANKERMDSLRRHTLHSDTAELIQMEHLVKLQNRNWEVFKNDLLYNSEIDNKLFEFYNLAFKINESKYIEGELVRKQIQEIDEIVYKLN